MKKVSLIIMTIALVMAFNQMASAYKTGEPTAIKPLLYSPTLEDPIPPPPADAVNLLHDEGFLTKEERDLLLYTNYDNLDGGEKSAIWTALRRLATRIANNARVRRVVREAGYAVALWAAEHLDGSGGGGGSTPCPGSPYNPYMEQ